MTGTITAFTTATRSGNLRYGRWSKFQTLNYWIPDWTVTQPMPVCWITRGGTLYNPGDDALQLTAGSFLEELALMMSNELGAVVIVSDYRPGGYGRHQTNVGRYHRAADVERLFFPEVLDDFALPGQYVKSIATDQSIWGAGNSVSTDADDWLRAGSSSGGWASGLSQLMPDGAFAYSPGASASSDPWVPRYSHKCNAVVLSIAQTVLSAFDKGSASDGWHYDTYGEYAWPGAYFMDARIADESAPYGWDDIPMSVKRQADFGEWITSDNHRCKQAGFYLTGGNVTGVDIVNDPSGVDADSFVNHYWRYTGNDPETISGTPQYLDLHDPWNMYVLKDELDNIGNTRSRLRAGTANTNPSAGERYLGTAAATASDVKTWLVSGEIGTWTVPA
ncbi:MAG: hypothetical protein VW405_00145 [Rhodospirillaceae bacterium]